MFFFFLLLDANEFFFYTILAAKDSTPFPRLSFALALSSTSRDSISSATLNSCLLCLREVAKSFQEGDKRQEFSVAELIVSLDVEERARAKDTQGKQVESSTANMVQRKNSNASRNKKKKNKQENNSKPKQTTTFKKKKNNKDSGCFVCRSDEHWASACPDRKYK